MISLVEILKVAGNNKASDVHLTVGNAPVFRIDGALVALETEKLEPADLAEYIQTIMTESQLKQFKELGELDLSFSTPLFGRYRVNAFHQRGSMSIVMRLISSEIPNPESLGLPSICTDLAKLRKGLVLVTGPTGSGKSTTLASMIDYINRNRSCHIVTIEDPIEYLHQHKLSLVNQREIGNDTKSFSNALRSVLRQDPDVILVGEMRDLETIATVVTAAETGHLVFSSLHTNDATQAVDRIIDIFPPHQQQQIRVQLASVLQGVLSQQLFPRSDKKGRVAAIEVLLATPAVRSLIREAKTYQLITVIQTNTKIGMQTMDKAIVDLVHKGQISYSVAQANMQDPESLKQ